LARDNPALFLTGSVVVGFGLSRFLKASSASSSSGSGTASAKGADFKSTPASDDNQSSGYQTRLDEQAAMKQGYPTTPPHTDDVYHSAHPGVPDSPAPSSLSDKAFGPGHTTSMDEFPRDGMSKGEL
jgi:hypothetical protein